MFTGIIESIGSIRALTPKGGDVRVHVETGKLDLSDVKLGDSIAVNGVCLTAVELPGNGFAADVSRETLDCTAMNDLKSGSPVNLEKALTPTTRLGGHLVSGHVDGVGEVVARTENARAVEFRIRAPKELAKYIAHKGSITVDGTSLTVNAVEWRRVPADHHSAHPERNHHGVVPAGSPGEPGSGLAGPLPGAPVAGRQGRRAYGWQHHY